MKPSQPDTLRSIQAYVLVVSSLLLVWLPTFDFFFHLDKAQMSNENRKLADFPTFTFKASGFEKFFSGLEQYFDDHFGFRNRLIRWQHRWKTKLFNEMPPREDIGIGRENWLYYLGNQTLENIQGLNPFTNEQLAAWKKVLESRRDWCAQRGIKYIFVVPPDKQSIYPEFLPNWLYPVKKPTKLDQFMSYMKTNSTVPILDLRPELLSAKTNGVLYFETDTHWNQLGAFIGYQALIKKLSEQLPDLKAVSLNDFTVEWVTESGQDIAKLMGQESSYKETANAVLTPIPPLQSLSLGMDNKILIKKGAKFNSPAISTNPNGKYTAIIFHDSYAQKWQPILGYNFKTVYFFWQYNWGMDFVEQQKPDVVIDEMLERFLTSKDPDNITENNE